MPPLMKLAGDAFQPAPNEAFPSGYVEITTENNNDGRLVISDISMMGMNLEDESALIPLTAAPKIRPTLPKENSLKLANELDEQARDDEFFDTLTHSMIFMCGGAQCLDFSEREDVPLEEPQVPALRSVLKTSKSFMSCRSSENLEVTFDKLHVREHSMTLGDHPSAATGPPIQLDWEHGRTQIIDLDSYERARQPRRGRKQLKMSFQARERVLMRRGFTVDEVKAAWEASLKVRQERYETLMQGVFSTKFEEACQSASRKFWRMFTLDGA